MDEFESLGSELICENRSENRLETLLNEEKSQHVKQLEKIDIELGEILKFKEDLEEEFDFEILTLISDLKQTCLPLFNEMLDRKQKLRLLRSELEVILII